MTIRNKNQKGAVSLFVVVFAALLITIVTVSFVRNMLVDQQQASVTDLSQSGYDSALVGVEDAKRALLYYQNVCSNAGNVTACAAATNLINPAAPATQSCNDPVSVLTDVVKTGNEVKVQTNASANNLDQAYTCVKIKYDTDDYIGTLNQDGRKFIPLVGVSPFNTIRIEWFNYKDLQTISSTSVDVPTFASGFPSLISQASWTSALTPNRPPILRAQLIQFSNTNGFTLSDLDSDGPNATNNTLFLYPSNIVETVKSFASDIRRTSKNITQVSCNGSLSVVVYSCSATITLPATISKTDRTAYLDLTSIYKKTNYRVTLFNNSSPVKFGGVQPEVDSTGRANDLFRRVVSRVEITDVNFPYPSKAVDLTGNLCKDFRVSDTVADYQKNCTP